MPGITYLDRIRLFESLKIKHALLDKTKLQQLSWRGRILVVLAKDRHCHLLALNRVKQKQPWFNS